MKLLRKVVDVIRTILVVVTAALAGIALGNAIIDKKKQEMEPDVPKQQKLRGKAGTWKKSETVEKHTDSEPSLISSAPETANIADTLEIVEDLEEIEHEELYAWSWSGVTEVPGAGETQAAGAVQEPIELPGAEELSRIAGV